MDDQEFSDFLAALRQREPQAFDQLIALCGPDVRGLIRSWLGKVQLRRVADSVDIWQSVLIKFDECVRNGQFQGETFPQLESYLRTLARNRFFDLLRKEQAAKRQPPIDPRQPLETQEVADTGSSPSQHFAYEELEEQFLGGLSDEARQIYARRAQGWTWPRIAAELGGYPSTLRVRFDREIERVLREMGLDKQGGNTGMPS
jgi:RNA polymerase sigma factor (sigma-70 family)